MAITATTIYDSISTPIGSGTQNNPVVIDLSEVDENGLAFNFILVSGDEVIGNNPVINFKYAFAMTSYTAADAPNIIGNSTKTINLRFPKAVDSTVDITPQFITPILGNYMYCWYDQENIINSGTFSASALPLTVTSYLATS